MLMAEPETFRLKVNARIQTNHFHPIWWPNLQIHSWLPEISKEFQGVGLGSSPVSLFAKFATEVDD